MSLKCPNCLDKIGTNTSKCDYCRAFAQANPNAEDGCKAQELTPRQRAVIGLVVAVGLVAGVATATRVCVHRHESSRTVVVEASGAAEAHVRTPPVPGTPPDRRMREERSPSTPSEAMARSKAAATDDERIRILQEFCRQHPDVYSFAVRNELRHYIGGRDPRAALEQCDVILREEPLHGYIMSILSAWVDSGKDPRGAVNAWLDTTGRAARLTYVLAACHYSAAEVLARIGEFGRAREQFRIVLDLRGSRMEPYHRRAAELPGLLDRRSK